MPSPPRDILAVMARTIKMVLEDWCINYVPASDPSRANHVILGKPTRELKDEIVISIYMNHPLGRGVDQDQLADGPPRKQDERPWKWPMESRGGMHNEKIIGGIQVNYRRNRGYEDAVQEIGPIMTRVKRGINNDARLKRLEDDMGNIMSSIQAITTQGHTSGGGDVTIDRQWVTFRAWVHSSNVRVELAPGVG